MCLKHITSNNNNEVWVGTSYPTGEHSQMLKLLHSYRTLLYLLLKGKHDDKFSVILLWEGLSDDVDREKAVFHLFSKPMAVGLF